MTSSFHGSTLAVDIAVPSGSEVALKLEGARGKAVFNRKGRVFFLWMNVGEVTIDNAPQAYMLYTSAQLTELASPETLRSLGLGLQALEPRIETLGGGIDRETMLVEFYDYKEKARLYSLSYGSLRAERDDPLRNDDAGERYRVDIALPSRVPVGVYEVGLYVFRDRRLVEKTSETVTIEKTGFSLLVSRLARDHPGEYGVLAIIVAVMAGFSIGLIFSRVGRRSG